MALSLIGGGSYYLDTSRPLYIGATHLIPLLPAFLECKAAVFAQSSFSNVKGLSASVVRHTDSGSMYSRCYHTGYVETKHTPCSHILKKAPGCVMLRFLRWLALSICCESPQ